MKYNNYVYAYFQIKSKILEISCDPVYLSLVTLLLVKTGEQNDLLNKF